MEGHARAMLSMASESTIVDVRPVSVAETVRLKKVRITTFNDSFGYFYMNDLCGNYKTMVADTVVSSHDLISWKLLGLVVEVEFGVSRGFWK